MAAKDSIDVLELLFSDINALLNVMNQLTDNYRLLVGAAEELTRTPGVGQRTINLAIDRADNTGTLIDIVIFTLFIKLEFTADVLDDTGIPLELFVEAIQQLAENNPEPRDPRNLLPRTPVLEIQQEISPVEELETEVTEEVTEVTGRRPGRAGRFLPLSSNSNPGKKRTINFQSGSSKAKALKNRRVEAMHKKFKDHKQRITEKARKKTR